MRRALNCGAAIQVCQCEAGKVVNNQVQRTRNMEIWNAAVEVNSGADFDVAYDTLHPRSP